MYQASGRFILVVTLLAGVLASGSAMSEGTSQADIEAMKLRIRELELQKEVLQLEKEKSQRQQYQSPPSPPPVQQYSAPSRSGNSGYYIRGPRGGCYTLSASGRKRYVDRSMCD